MEEYVLRCAVCELALNTTNPMTFYCRGCYKQWEEDITSNAEWVVSLRKMEQSRRYRAKQMKDNQIYVESYENYSDLGYDDKGNLIAIRDYEEYKS